MSSREDSPNSRIDVLSWLRLLKSAARGQPSLDPLLNIMELALHRASSASPVGIPVATDLGEPTYTAHQKYIREVSLHWNRGDQYLAWISFRQINFGVDARCFVRNVTTKMDSEIPTNFDTIQITAGISLHRYLWEFVNAARLSYPARAMQEEVSAEGGSLTSLVAFIPESQRLAILEGLEQTQAEITKLNKRVYSLTLCLQEGLNVTDPEQNSAEGSLSSWRSVSSQVLNGEDLIREGPSDATTEDKDPSR